MSKEIRLGEIIKLIAGNPNITLTGLCQKLKLEGINVSERTVAKDILALKHEYNMLPKKERLRQGYCLLGISSLSENEAELVLDALNVFGLRLNDSEAKTLMNRLLEQRAEALNRSSITRELRKSTRTIRQRDIYSKGEKGRQIQEILLEAMRIHQPVSINYLTPRIGKALELKQFPLLMVFHERAWYCIMRDLNSNNYHPRRLDRIRSCTPIKNAQANEAHSDDVTEAEFLMSCGWGMTFPRNRAELQEAEQQPPIVVRFERTLAPYILESFDRHPRGTVSTIKDGSGDAQFKIRLHQAQEFLYWVRSFGSRAWVVSPAELKEKEKSEVRRMYERYC